MDLIINKLKDDGFRRKIIQLIKYFIVGIITTSINIISYRIFKEKLGINYLYANFFSWMIALIFSFFANKFFVFDKKDVFMSVIFREFCVFSGSRIFTGILDMTIMFIFVELFHINDFYVKVFSNLSVIVLNYITAKILIFK